MVDVNNKLAGTGNCLNVVNKSPNGCDEMRVATIELTYPRIFNMGGASIFNFLVRMHLPKDITSKLPIFNHGGVPPVLYDIANGKRYIGDISNPDTVKIFLNLQLLTLQTLYLTTHSGNYYKEIQLLKQESLLTLLYADTRVITLSSAILLFMVHGSANYVEQYRQYRSSPEGGLFNAKVDRYQ